MTGWGTDGENFVNSAESNPLEIAGLSYYNRESPRSGDRQPTAAVLFGGST